MTNAEAAKRYREAAEKLSKLTLEAEDIKESMHFLCEQMDDNGDPEWQMQEAVLKLGVATAAALSYAIEYEEDAAKDNKMKKAANL